MNLILASSSPRRKEILLKFNYNFQIISSDFCEISTQTNVKPYLLAKKNALGKAKNVYEKLESKNNFVILGVDTIVVLNKKILGKPKDKTEAIQMLKMLSENEHEVISGFCIIRNGKIYNYFDKSKVIFNKLNDELINKYVDSGLPFDKAGGYGIQDNFNLVKSYKGSLYNIIGLPIEKIESKNLINEFKK